MMMKFRLLAFSSLALLLSLQLLPNAVNAQTAPDEGSYYRPECSPQNLGLWDLPKQLKEKFPHYENGKTAIFIYVNDDSTATGPNFGNGLNTRVYGAYIARDNATRFQMNFDEPTLKAEIKIVGTPGYFYTNISDDEDTTDNQFPYTTTPIGQPKNTDYKLYNSSPLSNTTATKLTAPDMTQAKCYVTFFGSNTFYSQSWIDRGFARLPNDLPYTSLDGRKSCDALDLPCHIASLFMPDRDNTNQVFNALKNKWQEKTGFMGGIAEKISALFAIFTTPTTTCTNASCSYNFGSMYGSPLTVNFAIVSQNWPTLWNYATLIIRGVVCVALVFSLRRKVLTIMERA